MMCFALAIIIAGHHAEDLIHAWRSAGDHA